jgi:hypothetical protein
MPILLMVFVALLSLVVIAAAVFYTFAFFNIDLRNYPWEVLAGFLIVVFLFLVIYLVKERLRVQRGLVLDARSIHRREGATVLGGRPMGKA